MCHTALTIMMHSPGMMPIVNEKNGTGLQDCRNVHGVINL